MKRTISIICLGAFLSVPLFSQKNQEFFQRLTDKYPDLKMPVTEPVKFLPEILTAEKHPHGQLAFSPDYSLVMWSAMIEEGPEQTIYFSLIENNGFTRPQVAPFAKPGDGGPSFSADGKRIYFSTDLSADKPAAKRPRAICFVEMSDSGWSEPVIIDVTSDTIMTKGQVTVAKNGNIYFSGRIYAEQTPSIYVSRLVNGLYLKPEKIKGSLSSIPLLVDPFVDPEERFILFSFPPVDGPPMLTNIGISFPDEKGQWGSPVRLNCNINTEVFERFPIVTDDGKYLFFIRSFDRQFVGEHAYFFWVPFDNNCYRL